MAVSTGTVHAAAPDISVAFEGDTLSADDSIRVVASPSLDVTVTADAAIDVVSVRVDGETRRTFSPNATSFSQTIQPSLSSGTHELTIVADSGTTATHSMTVVKDALSPSVRYTSPFSTSGGGAVPERRYVENASVTLSGVLSDHTGVASVSIERAYSHGARTNRRTHDIQDPNGSFSQPLFLGVGENTITVRLVDELGNTRTHEFQLVVRDGGAPEIHITSVERLSESRVRIEGYAVDDVQMKSVTLRQSDWTYQEYGVAEEDIKPEPSGRRLDFAQTMAIPSQTVVVEATDQLGRTSSRGVTVPSLVAPEITIDGSETGVAGDESVTVAGRVTNGEIASVTVETVSNETGSVLDIASAYDARGTVSELAFHERLARASGTTVARVRVLDADGTEHVRTVEISPDSDVAVVTTAPPPTRTPVGTVDPPTPTPSPRGPPSGQSNDSAAASPLFEFDLPGIDVTISVPSPESLGLPSPISDILSELFERAGVDVSIPFPDGSGGVPTPDGFDVDLDLPVGGVSVDVHVPGIAVGGVPSAIGGFAVIRTLLRLRG